MDIGMNGVSRLLVCTCISVQYICKNGISGSEDIQIFKFSTCQMVFPSGCTKLQTN